MRKNHYLPREENEDVGSEFRRERLYLHLRAVAMHAEALAQSFALTAEELLYHVTFSLDTLLEQRAECEEEALIGGRNLWQELRLHFGERDEAVSEADGRLAATLIVGTTANLLSLCHRAKYWTLREALETGAKEGDAALRERVEEVLTRVLYDEQAAHDLELWMREYERTERCLSDDIAACIEQVRQATHLHTLANEAQIVEELKVFFWNEPAEAEAFLHKIHGQDDLTVIATIAEWVNARQPRMQKKNKAQLWRVLHDHQLYGASQVNFSHLLRERGW